MKLKNFAMITKDKVTDFFCIADDFHKVFNAQMTKYPFKENDTNSNKMRQINILQTYTLPLIRLLLLNTHQNIGIEFLTSSLYFSCSNSFSI